MLRTIGDRDEREEHDDADKDGGHHARASNIAVVGSADGDGHDEDGDQDRNDDQHHQAHEKPHPEESPEAGHAPTPRSAEPGLRTLRRRIVHAGDQSGGGHDGDDEEDEAEGDQSHQERAYEHPVGLRPLLQVGDHPQRILVGAGQPERAGVEVGRPAAAAAFGGEEPQDPEVLVAPRDAPRVGDQAAVVHASPSCRR